MTKEIIMSSYMEMFYVDSTQQVRKTGLGVALESDAETKAAFETYRKHQVAWEGATFLLDYRDAEGDLTDTIALDAAGFKAITGEQPKSEEDYRRTDQQFWRNVKESLREERAAAESFSG
ncbi:hypothetical protein [Xanthomonas hortorum]|uniref:Large polyvalent protein associated domain-containing protein n=1 Tax=Xanthomonas hortorum pv. vitians TaxID=83224 RepID=A0AAW8ZRH9_9XANT|nr:hypothetical protein [Xanthomonas hortorum]MDV7248906.1 hypothetical protein [Xanthomonas hortorum pv. vitians]